MNVILAAGNQERWNTCNTTKFKVKQLIEIEGEILIERIQRQFDGCVMTHNEHIINYSKYFARPEKYRWTIETLLSSKAQWSGQTIVLLGDVYYTNSAAETITKFNGKQMFFGDGDEIFAVSFNDHNFMFEKLKKVIGLHERHKSLLHNGRLWTLYRHCNGIEILDHRITRNFTYINDDTQDFDKPEDYIKYL